MRFPRTLLAATFALIEALARNIKESLTTEPLAMARPPQLDGPCEGCADNAVRGVCWPTKVNEDTSHPWIEKCPSCRRFDSDVAAAEHLLELGMIDHLGLGVPHGCISQSFFGEPVEESNLRRSRH